MDDRSILCEFQWQAALESHSPYLVLGPSDLMHEFVVCIYRLLRNPSVEGCPLHSEFKLPILVLELK